MSLYRVKGVAIYGVSWIGDAEVDTWLDVIVPDLGIEEDFSGGE